MSSAKKRASSPEAGGKKLKTGHWSNGLKASMDDPDLLVESDELVVIIKDKYPKAKKHFLILPKKEINSIKDLKKENLSLLKHMHDKAVELSTSHLHLHLISQDFNSPCLKTKKHWNSFTTDYFVDSNEILKQVEDGKVKLMDPKVAKDLLNQPLRCHVCKAEMKTMPKLKDHIKQHE